jgi:hypothetical protein
MKTIIGTVAAAALGVIVVSTTAHYARAQATAAPAAQAPAGKKAKAVKDTAEYDIYNEVIKDSQANPPNPKKYLTDLDSWTQKYPNTDFKDRRGMYYVQAYSYDSQPAKALDAAKPLVDEGIDALKDGLENDGYVLQTLFFAARAAAALASTGSPNAEELATGLKASQLLADFGKVYFAADKMPAGTSAQQWADGLKQVNDQAQATQFQIALYPAVSALKANPKDPATCAAAEPLFRKAAEQYPDSGVIAQQLASITRCQQTKDPSKVQQALYYYARAVVDPVGGVGGLDEKSQKALDVCPPGTPAPAPGQAPPCGYLKTIYTTIHGSDEGLADLKALAAKSPNPPPDFKVKTASEVAAAAEEEFRTKNPQLAMWMSIKGQLADTNGQQYFDDQLKEHDMSGENGAKLLKGTLVEAKPACNPKELKVAIPMPNATGTPTPEITLKLDVALKGKPETGGDIQFNGVPAAFTKEPFMLTMDSSKDKIDGLTLAACAPARAPAAAPKKKGE